MGLKYIACSKKNEKLEVIDEEIDEDDDLDNATASRAGREVPHSCMRCPNSPSTVLQRL